MLVKLIFCEETKEKDKRKKQKKICIPDRVQGGNQRGSVGGARGERITRRAIRVVDLVQFGEEAAQAESEQVLAIDVDGLVGGAKKDKGNKSADNRYPAHVLGVEAEILDAQDADGVVGDRAVNMDIPEAGRIIPRPAFDNVDSGKRGRDGRVRHQNTQNHKV